MAEDFSDQERQLGALIAADYPVADELGHRFTAAGHELYLVGGTVRDAFLGRKQTDLDFATSAVPKDTEALLRDWVDGLWLTGARFGTVSATKDDWKLEITTYRADNYTAGSRHPQVTYGTDIAADLARRDFTINAMAVRVPEHRFVDPFAGLRDLHERVLRTPIKPETSFGDDPLRMVRLARFSAVLDAEVDDTARKAAAAMAEQIDTISRERIRDELSRLICAAAPERGVNLLCDTGLAERFLPEIPALRMQHDPLHHHKDVYAHTLAVVQRCDPSDLTLRLAALLHDIGKPATREFHTDGRVTFHGHDHVGARMARQRLEELRYPKALISDVCGLIYLHLRFHGYGEHSWTDSAVRRYVRDAGSDDQLRRLNALTRADVTTRNTVKAGRLAQAMDALESRIDALQAEEEIARIRPPLDGRLIMTYLGLSPGPLVGKARQMLLEARLDRGPMSSEEAYALLDEWADANGIERA
ncbi:MAG: CCA tRNA nucleotidyltransferase [Nitriliruptorales bacterium]|nr:CCA tRNA nucleotidyltransferase [Nitriliruptorales bacterium]